MDAQLKRYVDLMLKDITATYAGREKELGDNLTRQLGRYRDMSLRYTQLMAAYRSLRKLVCCDGVDVCCVM